MHRLCASITAVSHLSVAVVKEVARRVVEASVAIHKVQQQAGIGQLSRALHDLFACPGPLCGREHRRFAGPVADLAVGYCGGRCPGEGLPLGGSLGGGLAGRVGEQQTAERIAWNCQRCETVVRAESQSFWMCDVHSQASGQLHKIL